MIGQGGRAGHPVDSWLVRTLSGSRVPISASLMDLDFAGKEESWATIVVKKFD